MTNVKTKLSGLLMTVLQSVLLGFSALLCLSQAYSLDLPLWPTLAFCGGTALLLAVLMLPRRSWPFAVAAAILYVGLLIWQRGPLEQSLGYVLYRVTYEFSCCYDYVQPVGLEEGSAVLLLWALAVPLIWVSVWTCSREGSVLLVFLAYAPVFLLVLTIVDLAPVFWLILLTGGLLLLLLSQHIRDRSPEDGTRLAWWLVLPTIILVSGITVLWPPADYVAPQWTEDLRTMGQEPEQLETIIREALPDKASWSRELKTVDLRQEGPKRMTGQPLLDYRADTQISYLRGASLAVYGDNAWRALDQEVYMARNFSSSPLLAFAAADDALQLQVRTRSREPLLYTAYEPAGLPQGSLPVDDAYLKNQDRMKEYTVPYVRDGLPAVPAGYDAFVQEAYLQIPQELQAPLQALAEREGLTDVESVLDFVRNCGEYDLLTPRVPKDEEFVLYFLEQSHRGYCVHFATAAALLLRTVGIPSRYVTGFAVSGPPGQWQTVTMDEAHAWVEYYVPGNGWLPAEATPMDQARPEPVLPEPVLPPQEPEPEPPAPKPKPVPDGDLPGSAAPEAGETSRWLLLLPVPGAVLLLVLRRMLVCGHRRKRCTRAKPNRRALTYWHWLVQLCRVHSQVPEEPLLCLAEKARFSQHTLEEEELAQLRQAVEAKIRELRQDSLWKRLWYAYGRCLF